MDNHYHQTIETPPASISILIRTFNSAGTLGVLISRLDIKPGDEILVVDSGSTDNTLAIAEKAGARILKAEGPFNYSKSLNIGFRAARNPWVYVVSSHHIPAVEGTLAMFREAALSLPADVPVIYAPSSEWGGFVPGLAEDRVQYVDEARGRNFCGNANTLYRRSAWEEVPFDEGIETSEDRVWFFAMMERNCRVAYLPMARGYNHNKGSLPYMFHKGYRDAKDLRRTEGALQMSVRDLLGSWKQVFMRWARREISFSAMVRRSATALGAFFGGRNAD